MSLGWVGERGIDKTCVPGVDTGPVAFRIYGISGVAAGASGALFSICSAQFLHFQSCLGGFEAGGAVLLLLLQLGHGEASWGSRLDALTSEWKGLVGGDLTGSESLRDLKIKQALDERGTIHIENTHRAALVDLTLFPVRQLPEPVQAFLLPIRPGSYLPNIPPSGQQPIGIHRKPRPGSRSAAGTPPSRRRRWQRAGETP